MKQKLFALLLALALLLSACVPNTPAPTQPPTQPPEPTQPDCSVEHTDADSNGFCDYCAVSVVVIVDFYGINDLHGKLPDADNQPGADELTTYLKNARETDDHVVLLSMGDMWQGTAESNLTEGNMVTEWMNEMDFAAMAVGNHEYDWGEEAVIENAQLAEFPFLAINIYDRDTKQQVDYVQSSVMVSCGDAQIGIIGAIGDCYSSISSEQTEGFYFKTGPELTNLVKQESQLLRSQGADFIVYIIHDGLGESRSGTVSSRELRSYYDTSLSKEAVDVVFEAHTHQRYCFQDEYGVYHLQGGGDNRGITHLEVAINTAGGESKIKTAEPLSNGTYARLEDDPLIEELMDRYADVIAPARRVVGRSSRQLSGYEARQLVADLYYEYGVERWGKDYDIALGGGFLSVRDPGYIPKGEITYGALQCVFPFNNELVLCSVSGKNLKDKFFESDHYAYYISYGAYGASIKDNIDPNGTYYIVVDSYTSTYAPNGLTEIQRYDPGVYARDLLAEYIEAGGLE